MNLNSIRKRIKAAPENTSFSNKGWDPIYSAHPDARILIIGQAPGALRKKAVSRGMI